MKSLHEQLANKCKYFTGMINKSCSKGVEYESVKVKSTKPYQWPCFKTGTMSGGYCDKCTFPTYSEVKEQISDFDSKTDYTLKAIIAIKNTGNSHGEIICPKCGKRLAYSIAYNKHIHAKCTNCDLSFMQ